MSLIGVFKIFIAVLLIAIVVFLIISVEYGYECALPNGGYFKFKWDPEKKRYDFFHWQPKKNIKPLPKNVIRLQGEKNETEKKKH